MSELITAGFVVHFVMQEFHEVELLKLQTLNVPQKRAAIKPNHHQ